MCHQTLGSEEHMHIEISSSAIGFGDESIKVKKEKKTAAVNDLNIKRPSMPVSEVNITFNN
jgi:hypothetical protein